MSIHVLLVCKFFGWSLSNRITDDCNLQLTLRMNSRSPNYSGRRRRRRSWWSSFPQETHQIHWAESLLAKGISSGSMIWSRDEANSDTWFSMIIISQRLVNRHINPFSFLKKNTSKRRLISWHQGHRRGFSCFVFALMPSLLCSGIQSVSPYSTLMISVETNIIMTFLPQSSSSYSLPINW